MADVDAIIRNKTIIQGILATDFQFILDKAFEKNLITRREYVNLKDIKKGNMEDHAVQLVDTFLLKGRQADLIELLQDSTVLENFPDLALVEWGPRGACSSSSDLKLSTACTEEMDVPKNKIQTTDDQYPLSNNPLCVIINNHHFQGGSKRDGTEKDSESLTDVFSRLGFQVLRCQDQTKSGMAQVLEHLASLTDLAALQTCGLEEWSGHRYVPLCELPRPGDALVCCLLSHGNKGVVAGVDWEKLPIAEITATFNGQHCPRLLQKPKVFFIQACQGKTLQPGVAVDDLAAPGHPQPLVKELDGPPVNLIPVDADFLVAMASVENYQAVRNMETGSWFIQSLCKRLWDGRADDIMQILYRVNDDVSREVVNQNGTEMKQMPEAKKVTLRRRLVFSAIGSP